MIAEGLIICALWGGAVLVAVDGAWLGSYIAANNDRPEGMPSYFADPEEKAMYAMKLRRGADQSAAGAYEASSQGDVFSNDGRAGRGGEVSSVMA